MKKGLRQKLEKEKYQLPTQLQDAHNNHGETLNKQEHIIADLRRQLRSQAVLASASANDTRFNAPYGAVVDRSAEPNHHAKEVPKLF